MPAKSNTFLKTWGTPVLLALITIAGLLLAIVGTGIWHVLSWIALCIPLYLMTKHGIKFWRY